MSNELLNPINQFFFIIPNVGITSLRYPLVNGNAKLIEPYWWRQRQTFIVLVPYLSYKLPIYINKPLDINPCDIIIYPTKSTIYIIPKNAI